MPLSKPRRRRMLNLTPLIDVVFLLLVFFMLASTFLKFGTVKLETAGGGTTTADVSKVALIHIGAGEHFQVAGAAVDRNSLKSALRRLLDEGKTEAVIVMRKDAKAADLVRGLTQVRQSGFASVRVVD